MTKYSVFTAGIRESLSFTLNFPYSSSAFSFSFCLSLSLFSMFVEIFNEYINLSLSTKFPFVFSKTKKTWVAAQD